MKCSEDHRRGRNGTSASSSTRRKSSGFHRTNRRKSVSIYPVERGFCDSWPRTPPFHARIGDLHSWVSSMSSNLCYTTQVTLAERRNRPPEGGSMPFFPFPTIVQGPLRTISCMDCRFSSDTPRCWGPFLRFHRILGILAMIKGQVRVVEHGEPIFIMWKL